MHPEKVTVWCGFWSDGIIGPYFFQNEAGVAITVNERYRSMINNFLWPKMDDMNTDNMWFQQDSRMPRWIFCTSDLRAWLSRAAATWPRSCDLTPLDFFLWGYLKSQSTNKSQTIDALKVNIINAIQPDLCEKVIENWTARVTKRSRGGHLSDVIFHT